MRKRRTNGSLAGMLTSLAMNSFQTIAMRTTMMARGTCSPAEYRRMVHEKAMAVRQSTALLAAWPPASPAALIAPWHSKAKANAKRLARRRGA